MIGIPVLEKPFGAQRRISISDSRGSGCLFLRQNGGRLVWGTKAVRTVCPPALLCGSDDIAA